MNARPREHLIGTSRRGTNLARNAFLALTACIASVQRWEATTFGLITRQDGIARARSTPNQRCPSFPAGSQSSIGLPSGS